MHTWQMPWQRIYLAQTHMRAISAIMVAWCWFFDPLNPRTPRVCFWSFKRFGINIRKLFYDRGHDLLALLSWTMHGLWSCDVHDNIIQAGGTLTNIVSTFIRVHQPGGRVCVGAPPVLESGTTSGCLWLPWQMPGCTYNMHERVVCGAHARREGTLYLLLIATWGS